MVTKRRFRLVVLVLVAAAALAAAAGPVPAATPAAEPKVRLNVQSGFDGRASIDRWAPLSVEIANDGAAASGQLVARQMRASGLTVAEYVMPLPMPGGARKRVSLALPSQSGAGRVEVAYRTDSKELAAVNASFQVNGPDDLLVGVLSREPVALSALGQVRMAGRTGNVRVVRLAADSFPENVTMLANFHVLAITRFDSSRLTAQQGSALLSWVRRGGLLVLVAGPDWQGTLSGLPDELVPVRVTGTRSVEKLPIFEALGAKELPERGRPFALATGTLKNGRALASDGSDPIVAVGRPGQGTVLLFGVDLTLEPFASWSGASTMWETLLLQYLGSGFWSSGNASTGNPVQMARALSSQPMLTTPDVHRLLWWLGGYVLLVGPASFGLAALLRRRGLVWALVPVFSAAAVALLYYQGFVVEQRAIMTRAVSVTEVVSGVPTNASRTYLAVMAPSKNSLKVNLSSGDLAAPLDFGMGSDSLRETTRVVLDSPPAVELDGLTMWSLRGLMVDREVPGLDGLVLDLSIKAHGLTGQVINGTDRKIRDPVVVTPAGIERLPDLQPGGTAQVNAGLAGYRRPWQPVFQDVFPMTNNLKELRDQAFRRQVLEAALGATRDALPAPIMFVGWLDEPPVPIAAMGRQVAGTHVIFAPVQPKVDPKNFDLPHGLIVGKLVAAEGQQRGRSPRGYFVQEGALTFSLHIPDIDRSVLRDIHLAVETGGPRDTSKIKLLNWDTGQWDEVTPALTRTDIAKWEPYLARDGSMLVKVEVGKEGQEIRAPSISLTGR